MSRLPIHRRTPPVPERAPDGSALRPPLPVAILGALSPVAVPLAGAVVARLVVVAGSPALGLPVLVAGVALLFAAPLLAAWAAVALAVRLGRR